MSGQTIILVPSCTVEKTNELRWVKRPGVFPGLHRLVLQQRVFLRATAACREDRWEWHDIQVAGEKE